MNYDFKNNATFGSDGGDIEFNDHKFREVGYSDGYPFVPTKWEAFKTANTIIPPLDKSEKFWGMTYGYFANRGELISDRGIES
jgi:hypothetical protein